MLGAREQEVHKGCWHYGQLASDSAPGAFLGACLARPQRPRKPTSWPSDLPVVHGEVSQERQASSATSQPSPRSSPGARSLSAVATFPSQHLLIIHATHPACPCLYLLYLTLPPRPRCTGPCRTLPTSLSFGCGNGTLAYRCRLGRGSLCFADDQPARY